MERAARPTILLVSDLELVAQTVQVALTTRGYAVQVGSWAADDRSGTVADVGVLIIDAIDGGPRLRRVRQVLDQDRPWLVVTGTRRGPPWGALLAAGFVDIVSSTTSLDKMEELVRSAALGTSSMKPALRQELLGSWFLVEPELRELEARFDRLSARELEILNQLYEGVGVATIAQRLGVAEATVRSQVRSLFRKLHVRSQLAAVAVYSTCQ